MIAILSLLLVVLVSVLITRVATIALSHTGLSREAARFQARSAFTGAGFTTHESELVVNHPVRRRIVLVLMLLGNAGVVTAVSSLILTFVGNGAVADPFWKILFIVGGLVALYALATSPFVDRYLSNWIEQLLARYSRIDVRDYASLMKLGGDYRLVELQVEERDWLAGRALADARLDAEGVVLLGINRSNGNYLGAPKGDTEIRPGDTLLLYGALEALRELDDRHRSSIAEKRHAEAVAAHQQRQSAEERKDREAKSVAAESGTETASN